MTKLLERLIYGLLVYTTLTSRKVSRKGVFAKAGRSKSSIIKPDKATGWPGGEERHDITQGRTSCRHWALGVLIHKP